MGYPLGLIGISVVISSTLLGMQDVLNYLWLPIRHGLGSRGFVAALVLLSLLIQSYAWAAQPCHTIHHSQPTEEADHLHAALGHGAHGGPHAGGHAALMTSATMADHVHDHVSRHTGHADPSSEPQPAQSVSVLMLAHNCPACSACCLAAAVLGNGAASGLLDLRDPGPPAAIVLAQPLPPHDPPFHPPRITSFL